jgi:hypothetical protein
MKRYLITLKGESDLLMHADDVVWSDFMKKWEKDAKKGDSIAGDDRSPAFRWIGYLYVENDRVVMPSDNLMTAIREGASKITVKGNKTFKSQSQSGIIVDQTSWPLMVNGREIPADKINALKTEMDFEVHKATAFELGFELFCKRAKIGQNKHIRVRPRFFNWSCTGTITVIDPKITKETVIRIFTEAGLYSGLCDWRPSSPKSPGSFGKFTAEVEEI